MRRELASGLILRGDLYVTVTRLKDGRQRRIVRKNTITYNGIDTPLFLWAPDGVTLEDYRIKALVIGDDGTPPTRADLALGNQFFSVSVDNALQRTRSVGQVEVTATIADTDALGNTIREFGLLLGNDQLFSRQIITPIPLTGAYSVAVRWRIGTQA